MTLLHSTLTLAQIAKHPNFWTALYKPISNGSLAGHEFEKLSAGAQNKFVVASSNTALYLKGLVYEDQYPAHITLTPNDLGEWTYCHFTLETETRTAYYQTELNDDGEFSLGASTHTAVDYKRTKVDTKAETYWADAPAELREDLRVILQAMVEGAHVGNAHFAFEDGGVPA